MIEVNSIDAIPGEGEILTLMANYMANRLFTKRQRRSLSVIIDITREAVREPVTRRMLGPQKAGLGTRPPKLFEMTVSTAAGLRDAAEVIAHELLHISQAVNGRLQISETKKKINRRKRLVHVARWMGGKAVVMDDIAWHQRPWEIEACAWQGQLVTEFLMLTTGQSVDQPVQAPKRKQLALYPVSVPAPVSPVMQEPVFAPEPAPATAPATAPETAPAIAADENAASATVLETNEASIDRLLDGVAPKPDAAADDSLSGATQADNATSVMAEVDDVDLVAGLAADLAAEISQDQLSDDSSRQAQGAGDDSAASASDAMPSPDTNTGMDDALTRADSGHTTHMARPGALPDAPVYSKPVIEVDVPGLDAPRSLQRDAITKKLGELRKRGLATSEAEGR